MLLVGAPDAILELSAVVWELPTGCEFGPTQFPPLTMAKSLDDAKIGDYGIHLMRSFASAMHYERREGRNRLTLRLG
jgi:anti-sigma regulatory factor (Ser/Thr protein kinase)